MTQTLSATQQCLLMIVRKKTKKGEGSVRKIKKMKTRSVTISRLGKTFQTKTHSLHMHSWTIFPNHNYGRNKSKLEIFIIQSDCNKQHPNSKEQNRQTSYFLFSIFKVFEDEQPTCTTHCLIMKHTTRNQTKLQHIIKSNSEKTQHNINQMEKWQHRMSYL